MIIVRHKTNDNQEAAALSYYLLKHKGFLFKCNIASWRTDEYDYLDINLDDKTYTWESIGESLYPQCILGLTSYTLMEVWNKLQTLIK